MFAALSKFSPFERVLIVLALLMAFAVFALRFGTATALWLLHHWR